MLNNKNLALIEKGIIIAVYFLFPLFFLPVFPNYYGTAKLLLLLIGVILLMLIKAVRLYFEKKLSLATSFFDSSLYFLVAAYWLSVVVAAPNKVAATSDVNRGAMLVTLLVCLTFFASQEKNVIFLTQIGVLGITFLLQLAAFFNLFKLLPSSLSFVNSKLFSPQGGNLETVLYSALMFILSLVLLKNHSHSLNKRHKPLLVAALVFSGILVVFNLFVLIKYIKPIFMPVEIAWAVAVEGLKNLNIAAFGVGPGNYLAIFTQGKPLSFNANDFLWQANLEYSRSAFLQIFSEVGLFGAMALTLIFAQLYQKSQKNKMLLPVLGLIIWGIFFPLSSFFFFSLFLLVIFVREIHTVKEVDLAELEVVKLAGVSLIAIIIVAVSFFGFRKFYSDYLLQKAVFAAQKNEVQQVYDLQKQSIIQNPWNENGHLAFSQTNMVLANNISQKKKLTDQDKQNIAALVQQGIAEGKQLVTLNPNNPVYWGNLAEIYRMVINVAQGADTWTISAYQRAISLDKNNPAYYFNLGTVYYGLGNYEEAAKFFEQAVTLKPNYPNYSYNLAWSYARGNNYLKAVNAMEYTLQYVKKDSNDYKKAAKELAEFKKKLPKTEEETKEIKPETLTQPTIIPTVSPIMKLPTVQPSPTTEPTPTTEVTPNELP